MTEPRRAVAGRPPRAAPRADRSGVGGLVGSGPSVVGVSGAMRARDVSRPGEEHLLAAERDVVVRRRPGTAERARDQRAASPPVGSPAPDS